MINNQLKRSAFLTGYKTWDTHIESYNSWLPSRGGGPSNIFPDGRKYWGISGHQDSL